MRGIYVCLPISCLAACPAPCVLLSPSLTLCHRGLGGTNSVRVSTALLSAWCSLLQILGTLTGRVIPGPVAVRGLALTWKQA